MSVLGVGTDLVKISRIEKVLVRHGERFAKRILSNDEFERFLAASRPDNFLAKSFAAKEAVAKALGTGMSQGVCFSDIELYKRDTGQPAIALSGAAKASLERLGGQAVHISLSDEADLVSAFAIACT